jgi:GNAT superfamily N-acetyltransferase
MIDRRLAGTGLGAKLLDWAAEAGRSRGVTAMRLDRIEGNERLLRYYLDLGFRKSGRRNFDGPFFSTVLLEKTIAKVVPEMTPSADDELVEFGSGQAPA